MGSLPSQGTYLGCRFDPSPGGFTPGPGTSYLVQACIGGNQSMFLLHMDVSFSKSKKKKKSLEDKKKESIIHLLCDVTIT